MKIAKGAAASKASKCCKTKERMARLRSADSSCMSMPACVCAHKDSHWSVNIVF